MRLTENNSTHSLVTTAHPILSTSGWTDYKRISQSLMDNKHEPERLVNQREFYRSEMMRSYLSLHIPALHCLCLDICLFDVLDVHPVPS